MQPYTRLSLGEVADALDTIAQSAQAMFGRLDAEQLNWRPDATRWSVGQCLDHLLMANRLMLAAAEAALSGRHQRTVWHRIPLYPFFVGQMLIRSQAPTTRRRFRTPPQARPAAGDLDAAVLDEFVRQHRAAAQSVRGIDTTPAARTIMTSPFIPAVTYRVLDGCRLIVAHDHRHVQQAKRVLNAPGFPSAIQT